MAIVRVPLQGVEGDNPFMIPAEKTRKRKDQECHISQELDQFPMNK